MIAASLWKDIPAGGAERPFLAQLRLAPGKQLQSRWLDKLVLAQAVPARAGSVAAPAAAGWQAVIAGQLHNAAALARQLQVRTDDPAAIYAAAIERWGDAADEHCIGHYAAIAVPPGRAFLRLARSPFQAPPLHFRHDGACAAVAPGARSLFWREVTRPEPDLERLAQTLLNDHSDRFRAWYKGAFRLPLGSAVTLGPDGWREIWRYDLFQRPAVRLGDRRDYVEAALELFDSGVKAALVGAARPAIMLSGGLDSAMVAASALRAMPESVPLHAFTFGPEQGWDAAAPSGMFLSDFPAVRAFAEANPRIRLVCETNQGRDFRYRLRELIEAADSAPAMLATSWIEHALFEGAASAGCDVMLCGTWGNLGFSSAAPWAYAEHLRSGRWRALRQALTSRAGDSRPLWRRFAGLALMPMLPRPLWTAVRRLGGLSAPALPSALAPGWPGRDAVLRRARAAGFDGERLVPASRRAHWRAVLAEDGQDQGLYGQAMELIHGLPLRDPTAYRPLLEFCWGCPTDLFLHAGTDRWLAREMARDRLPDAQRTNRAYGRQFVDAPDRIARARGELLDELARMADDSDIAALIDLDGIGDLIAQAAPTGAVYDHEAALSLIGTVPLGMAAARFIAYAKGRNDI